MTRRLLRRGLLPLAGPLALLAAVPVGAREGRVPVDPDAVRTALETSWAERRGPGDEMRIVHVPALASQTPGELHVTWPDPPIGPGPRALTVDVRVDGRVVARALANVMISREISLWILSHAVARGDTLRANDLRRQTRVWDRPPGRALTAEVPPRGWVTRRDLAEGSWIRESDVRTVPDVVAGADLLLVTRTGDATVSVAAKARRSGSVGDTILVLNPLTGAVVRALLLDPTRAELVTVRSNRERSRS